MRSLKVLGISLLSMMVCSIGWCAWSPTRPKDAEKLKDTPALIRANWDAIATGTDASLQVTNAKVATNAGIVDTKLATISTAGKVNASALTSLSSTPAGAGALPIANGGTGKTTRQASLDALLDTQTGNAGKALITNATNASWGYPVGLAIASQAQGDLLYFNGTSWVRLAKDANASRALLNTGTNNNPAWGQVSLTTGVTGTLPVANGGTGTSTGIISSNQLFTSSGTFTAPTGITKVYITMCSAGGGGGGRAYASGDGVGGGGASGACVISLPYTVTAGNNYTVTVGAGGAGGVGTATGTAGGNSAFDSLSLSGGAGGTSGTPGIGGVASYRGLDALTVTPGGYLCGKGGDGVGADTSSGAGGSSLFGIGGAGKTTDSNGADGTGFGSGGSGAVRTTGSTNYNGGAGTSGFVFVQWL